MATTTYNRPGTFVEEKLLPVQPAATPGAPPAAFFQTNVKGPVIPTLVTSWTEYVRLFGSFNGADPLPHALFSFFNNGGARAYVCRVVGTGAATASRVFNDASAAVAASIAAHSPGTWGNNLYIDILAGTAAGYFTVVVYEGGTTADKVVERWVDLSMDPTNARYAESVVNTGSTYIRLTKVGADNDAPAAAAAQALAGGANGAAPTDNQYLDHVRLLDSIPDPVVLALPAVTTASLLNSVVAYAAAREDIFVVLDPPQGNDVATAVTYAGTLTPASSYAALYYPWISVADPSSAARNATRLVPPSGAVIGQMTKTDLQRGVFKTPAGSDTRINGAVAAERALSNADRDTLNTNHINAMWTPPGQSGVIIYGGRTMRRTLEADRYVSNRRTLIHLKRAFKELLAFAPFENNDERLWSMIRSTLSDYLSAFWQRGGLRGENASEAFFVKCDAEINRPETINQGYLYVDVGVALQFPAEFIVIRLGQFQGGATTATEL